MPFAPPPVTDFQPSGFSPANGPKPTGMATYFSGGSNFADPPERSRLTPAKAAPNPIRKPTQMRTILSGVSFPLGAADFSAGTNEFARAASSVSSGARFFALGRRASGR